MGQVLYKRKPVQFLPPAVIEDEDAEVRERARVSENNLSKN